MSIAAGNRRQRKHLCSRSLALAELSPQDLTGSYSPFLGIQEGLGERVVLDFESCYLAFAKTRRVSETVHRRQSSCLPLGTSVRVPMPYFLGTSVRVSMPSFLFSSLPVSHCSLLHWLLHCGVIVVNDRQSEQSEQGRHRLRHQ